MAKKSEVKEIEVNDEKIVKPTKRVSTTKVEPKKKFNVVGTIRKFDGIDYELMSTGIETVFGKTHRWGHWLETGVDKPKVLNTRCNITNVADVDITSLNTECLY